MKKLRFLMISLLVIVFAATLTACSSTPTTTPAKNTVNIQGNAFSPAEITIKQGESVTWVNKDSVGHTVVGTTFTSTLLDTGQSFTQVFASAGTFEYHCSVHPSMIGKVIVTSTGGY
jgi:plastocyanin